MRTCPCEQTQDGNLAPSCTCSLIEEAVLGGEDVVMRATPQPRAGVSSQQHGFLLSRRIFGCGGIQKIKKMASTGRLSRLGISIDRPRTWNSWESLLFPE